MCGIFGYYGNREANKLLLEGIRKLEYRGYDSFGMAVINKEGIDIKKDIGKLNEVERKIDFMQLKGKMGVSHSRWATTGNVTQQNAHPHTDCNNDIAVVHNGIIENYNELKNELTEKGHKFASQTDTEIIPHLIEEYAKDNDFEMSIRLALKRLEGTFAVVIIKKDLNKIFAARNFSPLVLGIGKDEFFIASDTPAFLEHTKEVVFLEDGDLVVIEKGYRISNFNTGKEIKRTPIRVELDAEQAQKGDYEHFMLKEIFEQPDSIKNTLRGRIKDNRVFFENFKLKDKLNKINRIIIIACGTSWHSALVGKYIIESLAKIPVEVDYASEFRYRNPLVNQDTLVIAISQSGETADTLAAIREAKSKNSSVLSICNVIGSTIPRESDETIYTRAGIEIGVASTKAFTTQLTVLYLLGIYFAQLRNSWQEDHLIERIEFLKNIPDQIGFMLKECKHIIKCAEEYYNKTNALYLGRGTNYPIALEGALKLKEVSYLHAEGYPAAEMKHGPIALIDNQMPVIVIAVQDDSYVKIKNNIEEIKSRGGKIIAIATEGDEEIKKLVDHILYVPKTSGLLYPFLTVIPLQLLAYYIAKLRECDIDRPRSLAKAVVVE